MGDALSTEARDKKMAVYSGWSAKADGFRCLPFGGHFIDFQFDERDGRLVRIAPYCPAIDL
jgi:hypothetical protein